MAGLFGGVGVAALLGFQKQAVEEANALPAATGAEEQERGSAAEFGGAVPVIGKAVGQSRGDLDDERENEIGLLSPLLKSALEKSLLLRRWLD